MPGIFDEQSLIRRVQRERIVALAGARALLIQAAHPVAFEGFFASTAALDDPYPRLRRTADTVDAVVFGERAEAERRTARVRRVHSSIRGHLAAPAGSFPAGTPWAADDPELLLWIVATLAESGLIVYERYVAELDPEEREAYWQDYRIMGVMFGLRPEEMPSTFPEFESYLRETLAGDTLYVTPDARELAKQIVLRPPVPLLARPLLELANTIVVGLLPARIRREYGLSWDPLRAGAVRGGAEYTRHLLLPLIPSGVRHRSFSERANRDRGGRRARVPAAGAVAAG